MLRCASLFSLCVCLSRTLLFLTPVQSPGPPPTTLHACAHAVARLFAHFVPPRCNSLQPRLPRLVQYPCFLSFGPFHLCYYFHMHPLPFPGLPQLVPTVAMYAVGPSKGPEGSVVSQGPCRSVPALSVAFCPSRPGSCEPLVCVCSACVVCAAAHVPVCDQVSI